MIITTNSTPLLKTYFSVINQNRFFQLFFNEKYYFFIFPGGPSSSVKHPPEPILQLRPVKLKTRKGVHTRQMMQKTEKLQSKAESQKVPAPTMTRNIYVVNPLVSTDSTSPSPPAQPSSANEYFYNDRGWLIYNNFTYAHRTVMKQTKNVVFWECRNRRNGCTAQIKTVGREVVVVNDKHNHVPSCPKLLKPIIYSET